MSGISAPHVSNFVFLREGGGKEGNVRGGREIKLLFSYLVNFDPA